MVKKNKSKTKLRYKCPECGSVMHRDIVEGVLLEFCSNDLLPQYASVFEKFMELGESERALEILTWTEQQHNLFGAWYLSTVSPKDPFACTYTVDPKTHVIPIGSAKMLIPDPVQVAISEKILKRPLTEEERYGETPRKYTEPDGSITYLIDRHPVPMLTEAGINTEGIIDHVTYPTDVSTKYKDLTLVYNPTSMDKLFDWEKL